MTKRWKITQCGIHKVLIRNFFLQFSLFLCLFVPYDISAAGSIQTFVNRCGQVPKSGDEVTLAKFSIIILNRFHYDAIGGDTWGAIKAINPTSKIYLYTQWHISDPDKDGQAIEYLNNLGRYNVSRGHSMGSLNGDNPDFFLKDSGGNRIYHPPSSVKGYVLDFGDSDFQDYSIEATINDFVGQDWEADGVYGDLNHTICPSDFSECPAKYKTDTLYSTAMNSMLNAMSGALAARGQKSGGNRCFGQTSAGYNAWMELDGMANPLTFQRDEGAFAISWGTGYHTQFYPETSWKRQVDLLKNIRNSRVLMQSHTKLTEGQTGIDNFGKPVTFWQTLWYGMGSYLLGKNDTLKNGFWAFLKHPYRELKWFDEYDLDIGTALGNYKISKYGSSNIYWREFTKGYIYVNPSQYTVSSIQLSETCKQLTHTNLKNDPSKISNVSRIDLKGHHAAVLLKSESGDSPEQLNPPDGLRLSHGD